MKKILILLALAFLFNTNSNAQLADGSIAPDWTMTDINGNEHHLYDYLDDGYTVVLDFSATWCGPCWSYHTSGALEELYENHGPAGMANVSAGTSDDIMVIMIEGDGDTTDDQLNGIGTGTQGDWVTGTPYPIIDDDAITGLYQIGFWPTIYTICSDRTIQVSGQVSAEAHAELAHECAIQSLAYQAENTSPTSLLGVSVAPAFTFDIDNEGEGTETLRISVSSNAPADWSGTISAGGNTDAAFIDVDVTAGSDALVVTLNSTPGTSAALADYTVEIESLTNPDNVHIFMVYTVISGITDLIIDNGGVASEQNELFLSGLEAANNTTHGVVSIEKFIEGMEFDQLGEVGHLYYNIAWTFPSFTNDGVAALTTFLDNGGNLFVAGQDIGWDTWDSNAAANGTTQTKAFYTNYLSADYQDDGSGSNSEISWETEDFLFGSSANTDINDIHNGNIYPDEFDAIDPAVAIYHYNSNSSKVGGVRVQENGHKVVYIGVDVGMMDDASAQDAVIQLSHDWFHGLIVGIEFDEAFKQSIGNSYPNPTNDFTTIPFENLESDVALKVINSLGQIIVNETVARGTTNYQLDVSKLSVGLYNIVLTNDEGISTNLSIEVVK